MFDIRDLLRLASIPRVGPQKIRALVSHFGDPGRALRASPRELIKVEGIEKKLATTIARHRGGEKFANEQLKLLNTVEGRIVTVWDQDYPELLKKIYDPPALLFVLGSLRESDRFALAIVGTRVPSLYGQQIAESFTMNLVSLGLTVVSGLARGIDTIAHETTLRSGGRTLAVIGSGLDVPYPPENRRLMEKIAGHGAVISEFPMGTKPDATNFPRRNRVVSGLSLGTLVVESDENGGAMITASTALDQNREVFAIPGPITEKRSRGPNVLIREGRAKLVQTVDDIIAELTFQLRPILKKGKESTPPPQLSLFERTIFDVLRSEPIHIDTIAELAASSPADALVTLLSLEFKGVVKQYPGKMFVKF